MSADPSSPAAERDNLLGVCAAIAEVTGIPALLLRIGFVVAMLGLSFEFTILGYFVLAAAVVISRIDWARATGMRR